MELSVLGPRRKFSSGVYLIHKERLYFTLETLDMTILMNERQCRLCRVRVHCFNIKLVS